MLMFSEFEIVDRVTCSARRSHAGQNYKHTRNPFWVADASGDSEVQLLFCYTTLLNIYL